MRLEGAIFDMDGTLLDSMGIWKTLCSDLMRELGRDPEPGLDRKVQQMGLRFGAAYCRKRYALEQSEDELIELVQSRVSRFYREEAPAKPGAARFLSLLKMQGVWMYLATAMDRALAEAALRRTGLLEYFRGMLTCTEAGCGKDTPLLYEKCLTRLQCSRDQCVVFEDSLPAIRTAKSAGFRVAAVWDSASEADQPEIQRLADEYIRSYQDFFRTV